MITDLPIGQTTLVCTRWLGTMMVMSQRWSRASVEQQVKSFLQSKAVYGAYSVPKLSGAKPGSYRSLRPRKSNCKPVVIESEE